MKRLLTGKKLVITGWSSSMNLSMNPAWRRHFLIRFFTMSKRKAQDDSIPAGKRLKHDVDAMGCLILAVTRDQRHTQAQLADICTENKYLHRQIERLDKYTEELEGRLASMEALITNMVEGGSHSLVEDYVHGIRLTNNYDMTDIDRILAEALTEDEEDPLAWFEQFEV